MWEEIQNYIKVNSGKVSISCEYYGSCFFTCEIHRAYHKKLPVQGIGGYAEKAFEAAKSLVKKVESLEKDIGKILAFDENTPGINNVIGGYSLLQIKGKQHVKCKTIDKNKYIITGIIMYDENGYVIDENGTDIKNLKNYYLADVYNGSHLTIDKINREKKFLEEGEELYIYDNISFLSGSAGFVVVKDGKIIRSKITIIS